MAKRDTFLISVFAGLIAVIMRDIYDVFAYLIGIGHGLIWQIGADVFVEPIETKTIAGNILGFLADLSIGGILGVLYGLFIEWRGTKHYIIKGWGLGLVTWLLFFGILQHSLPHTSTTAPTDALSNINSFIGHSIFGIVTAFTYMKLLNVQSLSTLSSQKEKPSDRYSLFGWLFSKAIDGLSKKSEVAHTYRLKRRLK